MPLIAPTGRCGEAVAAWRRPALLAALALGTLLLALVAVAGHAEAGKGGKGGGGGAGAKGGDKGGGKGGKAKKRSTLRMVATGRRAELRPTVPIGSRVGEKTKSVLSVKLPRLKRGQRVRFNGEVTITTTCVEQIPRCIGRSYDFDPRLRAQVVLAGERDATGKGTKAVSRPLSLTCEQTRPNRNHHCPMVVEGGSFNVGKLRKLPCKPARCRLNMALDASHPDATSDEFVVAGSDQPDGSVESGKGRLSAAVSKGRVQVAKRATGRELNERLPASFEGGKTVVYSQRIERVEVGDVLLVRSRQRTAISGLPYFVSNQIVVSTRRQAARPSALTRRSISRSGLASETNGFNCTLGPSAFTSPCISVKAGMARVERVPRNGRGRPKPIFVNVVARAFPKLAQARARYAPARVRDGGSLVVRRLRAGGRGRR